MNIFDFIRELKALKVDEDTNTIAGLENLIDNGLCDNEIVSEVETSQADIYNFSREYTGRKAIINFVINEQRYEITASYDVYKEICTLLYFIEDKNGEMKVIPLPE